MSLIPDILRSYRAPREVLRRRLSHADERHAIGILILACLMIFVAQWPVNARAAYLDPSIPLGGRLTGAGVAWMMIGPILLYALATLSHLVARLFGGACLYFDARFALFWALLAASPVWLLWGLAVGFAGAAHPAAQAISLIAFAVFMAFWLIGLIHVERSPVHPRGTA
ncbi:hypothetical protein AQS8620_01605 [Aquimixticola soesokkakensis]|uniref:Yip1 domain protein n=1 Tax=Aquimixticola soesokkakensis TaxID=1519096 RepID=A0A1Y5SL47_9RHOB|nr:hypothetical protein [Aquimixticola soesokkakensis]SLN41557.1 hypothetical protein AQS8620_01605 [Aquimixticola soesokkakensis]